MIERTILAALINEAEYTRKVIPYIDREYFKTMGEKIVFSLIREHFLKYNTLPNTNILSIELDKKNIKEHFYEEALSVLSELKYEKTDIKWLVDATEDFCKRRAYFNAIAAAAELLSEDDTTLYHRSLDAVSKALSVSFDADLGSDYFGSAAERFDAYVRGFDRLETTFESFNRVTKGGFVKPSLTVFMAPTGVGKSLFLCNLAASYLQMGKNVVYLTMEMTETQVEQRIDLNLLDLREDQIKVMEKSQFVNRVHNLRKKMSGKLKTKKFVSGSAHSGHFRYYLEELKIKENFIPDVIIVDYLNICAPALVGKNQAKHERIGQIALELRAIAQENNVPLLTATQTNRDGTRAADFDATDIADSWEVTHHADYIFGIIETEDLAKLNQMKVKRLKDRYNSKTVDTYFIMGVDKEKQRIYDIDLNSYESDESMIDDDFKEFIGS